MLKPASVSFAVYHLERRTYRTQAARPIEPSPAPPESTHYIGPREEELGRILKEILDRPTTIENRLKTIEEQLKTRR